MKKAVVDYSGFRLRELKNPRFSHLLLLLSWAGYFTLFFLTENLIPAERCVPVRMWLDDWIPFCEWFLIPYVLWYGLIVFSLVWFLLYDVDCFKRLQIYIIITQVCAMAVYIFLPNRQDLRPEVFPRNNSLTWIVSLLYGFDTNTNVCPSLHVAYSIGIASVWLKEKDISALWKAFVVIAVILICFSTAFIKQHSVIDGAAAVPVCIIAEWLVFYGPWKNKPNTDT